MLNFLLAPITAPINGITWIAEQIQDRVDVELDVKENLQKQLLTLQLAFDMGDVEEEAFEAEEEALLLAIQALNDLEQQTEA